MSARNRELMALIPASLLVTVGFAAIFIQRNEVLSNVSLTYGGVFLALCFVAHLVIRFTLPHADPYLFPLVAVLACFGLVVIYRIDEDLARVQAQWFVIGLIAFALTIFFLRDFRVLERYRYTIAFAGLALLLLPRVPGIGQQVNGAYLGVGVGPISFQPSELGKIAIVIFLAAYLQDNRRVLVQGSRRILGVTIPPLKHLGPLLVVWGAAMFMLVFIRDLGSSLMYFGAFLALLYVATNRLSFVVIGLADVRRRRVVLRLHDQPRAGPHRHLAGSVRDGLYDGRRLLPDRQRHVREADGGLFGRGLGAAALRVPDGDAPLIPAPETDMIFAVIVNDLGLVGGAGVIATYLLIAERGFKIATLATRQLLQAARDRPDRGDGAAGVRDRGRRHPGDPAHGRHPSLRELWRVLDRRELHPARAAAADLQPGAEAGMNVPIYRLFLVFLLLFAVLVGFTSRWAVFGQQRLRENPNNARVRIEEQQIKRGVIRAANKEVLAGSTRLSGDRYGRRYPTGRLFALPVGFDDLRQGRQGLEKYYNDALVGRKEELSSLVDSLISEPQVGDDLQTTLVPRAQELAYDLLEGHKGAVVALGVRDGSVKVLAGTPSFDPNKPAEAKSVFNRATQGLYPPGSTMKTVTASAAIDSGRYEPDSRVSGKNGKVISGTPLNNFSAAELWGHHAHRGPHELRQHGVGRGRRQVGRNRMQEYMDRFGFGEDPPMDYPDEQMNASGPRDPKTGAIIPMSSDRVDVGRTAIGQALLLVTPLQMATVAQTIGNGGMRMEPRLVQRITDPEGRTVDEPMPEQAERVMSQSSANKVATMMRSVVREGSGTAAALEGVEVAGKTGTAEINIEQRINDLWFIGFTKDVAVAVIIEREQGQGGTVAAPIAKQVLQALGQ